MTYSYTEMKRFRKNFGKHIDIMEPPKLLSVQCDSYQEFLEPRDKNAVCGLETAFQSIFPIVSFSGVSQLEYVSYQLGAPLFDVNECRMRGLTYSLPLRVKLRLVIYDKDASHTNRSVKDIKEQEVFENFLFFNIFY